MGFPISINLMYTITRFVSKQATAERHADRPRRPPEQQPQHRERARSPLPPGPSTDASERFLSPSAFVLQTRIREKMLAKRENQTDACSLSVLEAASARDQRRARASDARSLEILLRAAAGGEEAVASPTKASTRCSSWSSFENVEAPSLSPRKTSPLIEPEGDRSAYDSEDGSDLGRSVNDERRSRGHSAVLQSSCRVPYRAGQSVAELMGYYEELAARDDVEAASERSEADDGGR